MSPFQTMMVTALLVSGMGVALLGSVKVALAQRVQIDEVRVGGLVSLFGFVMIPVIFTAGFLTDHIGKQAVLIAGSIGLAASLGGLALSRNYLHALGSVVLLSAAWALLVNAGNVLVPFAFAGDPPDPTRLAYATNLANVFFGMGAFLTPLAVAFLFGRTSFPVAIAVVAVFALAPAILSAGVDFARLGSGPAADSPASPSPEHGLSVLLGDPIMWLCGLALFFYGPLEASMGAWTTTYLGGRGVNERVATRCLSGFWLAFMAARLVTAFSLPQGAEAMLILGLSLSCIGVMLGIVISQQPSVAVALVIAAGLVFGPIFPTLMAVLFGHFDKSLHGRAVGLLFAIGGVGWTLIPLLIGTYAQKTSVQRAFVIAVGAALGLSGIALLLLLR